jgi:two-component system, LytTR family, sensor kinase
MHALKIQIPKYTSKDGIILLCSMLPYSILINSLIFKERYFNSLWSFTSATFLTFIIMAGVFMGCGSVAVFLRHRFSDEKFLNLRLFLTITIFILTSAVVLSLTLRAYELFGFLDYSFTEKDFIQSFVWLAVLNVFLTFLNEGVSRFEKYKATLKETELLKKEYRKSQLMGLKSQVNPHFLFNSLNTLSSLIYEDEEKAEQFLDELSKVYRYLLRNDDDQLVTLEIELAFTHSYHFLLKARYGDGFHLAVDVPESKKKLLLPPLTLQVILENIFNCNRINKSVPLLINISYVDNHLEIRNSIQPKLGKYDSDMGLENLANRFWLLFQKSVNINTFDNTRVISLPLIIDKGVTVL